MSNIIQRVANKTMEKNATIEIFDMVTTIVRDYRVKVEARLAQVVKMASVRMLKLGWIMDDRYSYVYPSPRGGNDGRWLEGELVFVPADKEKFYQESDVRELFEKEFGLYGYYDWRRREWKYSFD